VEEPAQGDAPQRADQAALADDPHAQVGYAARFDWGVAGLRRLAPTADIVVVVDVLTFTTAVEAALSAGAVVLPYRWRDPTAAAFAERAGARLAVTRDETRASGGLSLSPPSLATGLGPGDRLVLPSPNGATCAVEAMALGCRVAAACLRNARAVADFVTALGGSVLVCAAGERWPDGALRPAYEDLVGAGAVLAALADRSPEADAAAAAFADASANGLARSLHRCASGRELVAAGWPEDVEYAARVGCSDIVPVLDGDAFRAAPAALSEACARINP
jgi:2-phosphosulfolactate phosphatase